MVSIIVRPIYQAKTHDVRKASPRLTLTRLVYLIETRAESLTEQLVQQVSACAATPAYSHVPPQDLHGRVHETYRHVAEWLLTKDEQDIERRYRRIGAERASQGVPFSQLAWVVVMTKDNLWEFLRQQTPKARPVATAEELKMLELLDRFFDMAIYYAALGYESGETQADLRGSNTR